jgi:hypothetical protein
MTKIPHFVEKSGNKKKLKSYSLTQIEFYCAEASFVSSPPPERLKVKEKRKVFSRGFLIFDVENK